MSHSQTQPAIAISGLSKTYQTAEGSTVKALESVDLEIQEGHFVSVIGPSGCGKSTLLKILAGLLPSSTGEATIEGSALRGPSTNVGVVFQEALLLPWLTIRENVLLPIRVQRRKMSTYQERAEGLLERVGLAGFQQKYPNELSGGMQQRVGIARALVTDPPILLMDEPFGALDALTRERMNEELQQIWMEQGKTVFFITHSIPEAVLLSDRLLVMSERPGRIIEDISINYARPRTLENTAHEDFSIACNQVRTLLNARGQVD